VSDLGIFAVAAAVLLVVAVSGRLSKAWLTEPMAMVVLGVVYAAIGFGQIDFGHPAVLVFLELTLALVLFTDAARIDLKRRGRSVNWPARMLGIGLPLAMVLGALVAAWILDLPLGLALLLGVILAPTDAALAEPVIEAETLPVRVKQSLNVESGLNDGLALPALFIAIGIIDAEEGSSARDAILLVIEQVGIGIAGGIVFGLLGAWILIQARQRGMMDPLHQRIATMAVAIACFGLVQYLGGSGFVATFVAGGLLRNRIRAKDEHVYQFAETEGKVLVLAAFLFVGAGPIYMLFQSGAPLGAWLVALISLFVVRPLAIALSLVRAKLLPATMAFLGWFGPRGLATVVFFLVAAEEVGMGEVLELRVVPLTIALSVLLHGLTAKPASEWLARRIDALETEDMAEMEQVYEHPMRTAGMDDR
jgi:NhaP-type Na+/H+ or K+/H+ antiporter